MTELNKKFGNAIQDLVYLLERNYPKNSSITLVGNRYRLTADERMILYRGVFKTSEAARRRSKILVPSSSVPGKLVIDGYNVLITLESYLLGKTVFRSMDGFVRDISGIYGNYRFTETAKRSIELLADYVRNLFLMIEEKSGELVVYLDAPVSKSGELAVYMRNCFKEQGITSQVEVLAGPDVRLIEEGQSSVVATSDTVIADQVPLCADIPGHIITNVLKKHIIDLQGILDQTGKSG